MDGTGGTPWPVEAIVLAAGQSRRMGRQNKLLLDCGNRCLLEVVVERLVTLPFREVLVVLGNDARQFKSLLASYPVRIVENPQYRQGIATSIRAGVREAPEDVRGYLFYLADMPFVRPQTLRRLCRAFLNHPTSRIVIPTYNRQRGNPVIVPRELKTALLELKGDVGARQLLQRYSGNLLELPVDDPGIHRDIDTEADVRRWLKDSLSS